LGSAARERERFKSSPFSIFHFFNLNYMAMPTEEVVSYPDTIAVTQVLREPLTQIPYQIRETIYGKTNPHIRVVATKQEDTQFTRVQILAGTVRGYEPIAMASDDPADASFETVMLGWAGSNSAPIDDLLTLCRTTLFETVYTITP
jgi:hypothetical protein